MALRETRQRPYAGAWLVAVAFLLSACTTYDDKPGAAIASPGKQPSSESLSNAAQANLFFGHQSVGMNILDGVPAVYAAAGVKSPPIIESASAPSDGPVFAHTFIGLNGDPSGKIQAFAKDVRSGYGAWADVAFMKLCYVDVVADTNVDAIFAEYKQTMAALEGEFPDVAFLHMTGPLTTEPGTKERVKVMLGRGIDHRKDNIAREKFNSLIRAEYQATGRLVDVAAMESTTPDGTRVSGQADGQTYYALYEGFASDSGHLNAAGAEFVAAGLLEVVGSTWGG